MGPHNFQFIFSFSFKLANPCFYDWEKCPGFTPNTVCILNKLQWISIDGSVIDEAQGTTNNAHISDEDINLVLQGNSFADMSRLVFRDPDTFRAGELHRHTPQWNVLLDNMHDERFSEVRAWIVNGVDVTKFFRPFKCSYKGKNYECSSPPPRIFPNHLSCKPIASLISDALLDRLRPGAISLWGKVGECTPPHLVMPLTVEPIYQAASL